MSDSTADAHAEAHGVDAAKVPAGLTFRPPSTSPAYQASKPATSFAVPPPSFLAGPWHVTHSTLPMWKSNRNVVITYTYLSDGAEQDRSPNDDLQIDDLVTYAPNNNPSKQKTVKGIDTPDPNVPAAWDWRGKGWLKIASSHWEVIGWGENDGGWVVTFFAKTLFTPAGIDIYARRKGGLSEALLESIKTAMRGVEDEGFREQAGKIFQIEHDW
jgi:hypothetical protein